MVLAGIVKSCFMRVEVELWDLVKVSWTRSQQDLSRIRKRAVSHSLSGKIGGYGAERISTYEIMGLAFNAHPIPITSQCSSEVGFAASTAQLMLGRPGALFAID